MIMNTEALAPMVDSALRALSVCATGATIHHFNNRRTVILGLREAYNQETDPVEREALQAELELAVRQGMTTIAEAVYNKRKM